MVAAPDDGVWRVGRASEAIFFPEPPPADLLDFARSGNRFDSPTENFRVCYFASTLEACFGETLARLRPDPALISAASEEGFMPPGEVPADWRAQRVAVRVRFPSSATLSGCEVSRCRGPRNPSRAPSRARPLLAYYGYDDLDIATVRGGDRRITRWISKWAYDQRDEAGQPIYAGIRYLSRLSSEWECWAVFEDVTIEELSREPIRRDSSALGKIARQFELTVF